MGTVSKVSISALASALVVGVIAATTLFSEAEPAGPQDLELRPPSTVNYPGFMALTEEVSAYRESRLVTLEQFLKLAQGERAIILDTRSKAAFDAGHIKGAVHLNFSDFTEASLAGVIGDKTRPILIYCNNNFADNAPPVLEKKAPLALNIPTFINLYGYGYKNIYELRDLISMSTPADLWVTSAPADIHP